MPKRDNHRKSGDVDIKQLQCLLEVSEAGSINRAAERLGIAQSAVSRRLASLEADLGAVLLRRSPEGVTLTQAGLQTLQSARAIMRELDDLRRSFAKSETVVHRVRLGLPPTVSALLLKCFEQPLRQGVTQLLPSVVEASSYWLSNRLTAGDLDCAVLTYIPDRLQEAEWRVEPLWLETLCLVGPSSAPQAVWNSCDIRRLNGIPLTLTPAPDNSRQIIEQAFRQQGLTPTVVQEHEALNLLKEQVRHGAYSILPYRQARELAREGGFCLPVEGLVIRRAFVYKRNALATPLATMLLRAIREHVASAHQADPWFQLEWDDKQRL